MISYYEKRSVERPIRKSSRRALLRVLDHLGKKYKSVLGGVTLGLPGVAAARQLRSERLESWLNSKETGHFFLDLFVPKQGEGFWGALQLRDIANLGSSFGKANKAKCRAYILVYSFGEGKKARRSAEAFSRDIADAVRKAFSLKRRPACPSVAMVCDVFEKIQKKGERLPNDKELSDPSLLVLCDPGYRNILVRTKQAKEPTVSNVAQSLGLQVESVLPVVADACRKGLLARKYNVLCASCKKVMGRVPSKRSICQMQKDEVTCAACNTLVDKDSYEEAYFVPDHTGRLLEGSRWLSVVVVRALTGLGIPRGRILLGVRDGPNELDIVANVDGSLLLIELKDARFSIGHAYSFVGKCSQYRPDVPIIIATEGISPEVKEYLANVDIEAGYIEDVPCLDGALGEILSKIYRQKVGNLLGGIGWDDLMSTSLLGAEARELPPADAHMRGYGARMYLRTRSPVS